MERGADVGVPGRSRRDEQVRGERRRQWIPELWQPSKQYGKRARQQREELLLPESLVFNVLRFLPLRQICRLRVVCKAWNTLLRSEHFLQAWYSASSHEDAGRDSWLVLVRKARNTPPFVRELIAFDAATRAWIPLRPLLQSLPPSVLSALGGPSLRCVASYWKSSDTPCLAQFAAASAAGLVAFLVVPFCTSISRLISTWTAHTREIDISYHPRPIFDEENYSLLVLNLVTGSHQLLPPPIKHRSALKYALDGELQVCILPIANTPHYKVLLSNPLDCHDWDWCIEVYDSRGRSWEAGPTCSPGPASTSDLQDAEHLWLSHWPHDYTLVNAYNARSGRWHVARAPALETGGYPTMISLPGGLCAVLRHRGRIFGAAVQFGKDCFQGFAVWELHMDSSGNCTWAQVARTPSHLWEGFYPVTVDRILFLEIKLLTSGSLVWMTAVECTDSNYGGTYYPPLVYDVVRNSWYHLPAYDGGHDSMGVFTLQPSFVATA